MVECRPRGRRVFASQSRGKPLLPSSMLERWSSSNSQRPCIIAEAGSTHGWFMVVIFVIAIRSKAVFLVVSRMAWHLLVCVNLLNVRSDILLVSYDMMVAAGRVGINLVCRHTGDRSDLWEETEAGSGISARPTLLY